MERNRTNVKTEVLIHISITFNGSHAMSVPDAIMNPQAQFFCLLDLLDGQSNNSGLDQVLRSTIQYAQPAI